MSEGTSRDESADTGAARRGADVLIPPPTEPVSEPTPMPVNMAPAQPAKARVAFQKNGPMLIEGPATIDAPHAQIDLAEGHTAALCRCGQSPTKPFCSGEHKECDFEAEGTP